MNLGAAYASREKVACGSGRMRAAGWPPDEARSAARPVGAGLAPSTPAVVAVRPGPVVDEAAIRALVAERPAGCKVPVRMLYWCKPLPRDANGEVLRPELQKPFP